MPLPLIERWREHLALEPGDPVVTLNEGSTPLVEAPVISELPSEVPKYSLTALSRYSTSASAGCGCEMSPS